MTTLSNTTKVLFVSDIEQRLPVAAGNNRYSAECYLSRIKKHHTYYFRRFEALTSKVA